MLCSKLWQCNVWWSLFSLFTQSSFIVSYEGRKDTDLRKVFLRLIHFKPLIFHMNKQGPFWMVAARAPSSRIPGDTEWLYNPYYFWIFIISSRSLLFQLNPSPFLCCACQAIMHTPTLLVVFHWLHQPSPKSPANVQYRPCSAWCSWLFDHRPSKN